MDAAPRPGTERDAMQTAPCVGAPQPTRLRISSLCEEPIWIASSDNVGAPKSVKLTTGECFDVPIPAGAVASTRFWPKTGCDAQGEHCTMGQSVGPCPSGGCQPPIESKFEATFADAEKCPTEGASGDCVTWYNGSQVDGYTLPFEIIPKGRGSDAAGCTPLDCSGLELARCPSAEDLSQGGKFPAYSSVDLRVFDDKDPAKVVGCMAPCKRLNFPVPWGLSQNELTPPTVDFCCPTPPISAEQCREGPVTATQYVNRLQEMCPDVYSYAYDDADALRNCPAQTQLEVIFCSKK